MKEEIHLHTRREFLRRSIFLTSVAWTVPTFLNRTAWALENSGPLAGVKVSPDDPILVVIQLSGGNDGLNTLVPYANDAYYKARPMLAVPAKDVLKVNDVLGFHPNFARLKSMLDSGKMAVIQGVGYPNPNRSHFRSMEIWHTASDSDKYETSGWIGRYFDNHCKGCDPTTAVNIGKLMPQAFSAKIPFGVTIEDPEMYRWINTGTRYGDAMKSAEAVFRKINKASADPKAMPQMGDEPPRSMDYLQRTAMNAQLSSDKIREVVKQYHSNVTYPDTGIGYGLKLVAQMISGKLPTRIYYVSQGGYDTHANQLNDQNKLLAELSEAVFSFYQDLEQQRNDERVLSIAFSEFGRRVTENASKGTDHGAAGLMFAFGGKIKPGIHGEAPSLTDLNRGDLKFNIDFRSVYATVLENWLRVSSTPILGRSYPKIGFV